MSLASLLLADNFGLPKRLCRASRTRGIRIPMRDGVELATEYFAPKLPGKHPTLLIREPYGLSGFSTIAEIFAERGYHTVLQACRGTDKSGGTFDPLRPEREDGLATLDWIKKQPWYDGRLGTTGPSYLGYAQWAICDALPPRSAMSIKVTSAEFRSVVFPGGSFAVGLWLSWMQTIEGIRGNPLRTSWRMLRGGIDKLSLKATMKLPLRDADRKVTGHKVPFWQQWLDNAIGDDAFWEPMDHTHRIGARTPPTSFTSGWYDFMLDQLLRDYALMVDAGQTPRLTIGPWVHVSPELQKESVRDTLTWMDVHLRDALAEPPPTKPVKLFVTGLDQWREFDAWPPGPPLDTQIWQLHPGGGLSQRPVRSAPPDTYTYDPTDPTPAVGGAMFAFTGAGATDNAPLEKRKDVLVYTSDPLFSPLTVMGNVGVTVYARASLTNADVFVRLCDVDPNGKSVNICDGIIRKTSSDPAVPDDIWRLTLRLHATAHHFKRDHRLRVIVASGAHPRFARNTGTDESLGEATTLVPVDIEIFHDPQHPSALHLPIYDVDV
ncbi:CocE/NonD family hydrolase, partial [Devosia sp.]|uniref:CocE/NonD family hydrolase n=1 Tax=Devosia sp. TaxID=1871048 RepID=UPI003A95A3F6